MNSKFNPLDSVTIPATTTQFVAKEKFVLNHKGRMSSYDDDKIEFFFFSKDFVIHFLGYEGKIEGPIEERVLHYAKLLEDTRDIVMCGMLGGDEESEVTLSEVFSLMEKQKHGEDGVLSTITGNTFYVRDRNGVLCAVRVLWDEHQSRGWLVSADTVYPCFKWANYRHRVFSHSPALKS